MLERQVTANAFSIRFPATFADVARVLEQIKGELPLSELPDSRLRDLELVLAESLNNVSEHAYSDGSTGEVELAVSHRLGVVRVEIRDDGKPLPLSLTGELDPVEPTAEGGRGWWLIRTLCKSVDYRRRRGTNCLVLEFISSD
ncbi:MAG: ATP-binding protein [Deltaproteobacteria bacterium]